MSKLEKHYCEECKEERIHLVTKRLKYCCSCLHKHYRPAFFHDIFISSEAMKDIQEWDGNNTAHDATK